MLGFSSLKQFTTWWERLIREIIKQCGKHALLASLLDANKVEGGVPDPARGRGRAKSGKSSGKSSRVLAQSKKPVDNG